MTAVEARLTSRWPIWFAWCMAALVVAFTVLHLGLWTLASLPGAVDSRGRAGVGIAFALVGALIITRRPRNAIGWLFCAIGFSFSLHGALDAYALYAVASRPDANLPAATAAAWLVLSSRKVEVVLVFLFVPLLYPTGRLPSPRWRSVAWLGALSLVLMIIARGLRPGLVMASEVPVASNPLGIAGATQTLERLSVVAEWGLFLPVALAAAASVIMRLRHARGIERQQLKWFVYAIVAVMAFDLLAAALPLVIADPSDLVVDLITSALAFGLPVALGIAVLRYHLYDIDRLVNRTLVYGLLTILLGLIYAAGVVTLGQLLEPGDGDSELAVAVSTLAVAALFRPLRRRVQLLVDRRFNRRHYDATRIVEAFSAHLRSQVDLETLSAELLEVVNQTVEPSRASLWLRPLNSTRAKSPGMPWQWRVLGPTRSP